MDHRNQYRPLSLLSIINSILETKQTNERIGYNIDDELDERAIHDDARQFAHNLSPTHIDLSQPLNSKLVLSKRFVDKNKNSDFTVNELRGIDSGM